MPPYPITVLNTLYQIIIHVYHVKRLQNWTQCHIRRLSEKFVDTFNIFNSKRNAVKMNVSGFAKVFHEQIDEI